MSSYIEGDAKWHCINDVDKFDISDTDVILYLEKVLFDAGEDGLAKKTPWNTSRRSEAELPMILEYE